MRQEQCILNTFLDYQVKFDFGVPSIEVEGHAPWDTQVLYH